MEEKKEEQINEVEESEVESKEEIKDETTALLEPTPYRNKYCLLYTSPSPRD